MLSPRLDTTHGALYSGATSIRNEAHEYGDRRIEASGHDEAPTTHLVSLFTIVLGVSKAVHSPAGRENSARGGRG